MKTVTFIIVLLAGGLAAQVVGNEVVVSRLTSNLVALQDGKLAAPSHTQRIADDIMSLSKEGHRPTRMAVEELTDVLTDALTGQKFSDHQASPIAHGVLEIMQCSGIAPSRFRESIVRTEIALASIGVNAEAVQAVADRLAVVGDLVRGPEDVPLGESLTK